jgi:hypothetical protein
MPYPSAKVEIAFNDGPYVASPTWTDVTSDVREMTVDRGRDDDWGTFSGDAMVVLNNRSRTYDPFNSAGPYFGKLLPRRQIRITANYGGTDYPVFRGFVAGWPPVWTDAGKDSTVTLSCMDALGLLTSDTLPDDWVEQYILSLSPRHYWKLNDPVPWYAGANFTVRDLGSAPSALQVIAASAYSSSSLASGITASSIGSEVYLGTLEQLTSSTPSTTSNFTMCFWTKPTNNSQIIASFANTAVFFGYNDNSGTANYQKWSVNIRDTSGNNLEIITVNTYTDTDQHHIAFTYNAGAVTGTLYIDGFAVATTGGVSSTVPSSATVESFRFGSGSFQEVAIFPSILTLAQVQTIVRLSEASVQETTAARFTRLIANTQFPASLTSTASAPVSAVLDLTPGGVKVASELQLTADSEYAPLFVDRSGVLTLYNQNQIRTQTRSVVSQGTYGAGGIAIGPDVAIAYDGDSMRNEASIQMSGQGFYNQDNTTSQTTFGVAEESLTTQVQTFANAIGIANIVTGWGGQVYPKADPFDVVLSPSADWSNALNRELNDRITLVIQPPTGSAINTQMLLSSIRHSVVPGEWRTTFEGSARWAAVFILNKSTLGGTDLLG